MLKQTTPASDIVTNPPYTTYTYDQYNRLTCKAEFLGKKATYTYNKNEVTSVEYGISTTRTYDSQGNMTSVTDSTGTTTYVHRPDGQLLSATLPTGRKVTIEYDNYGRQTKLSDPCAGTTTFTYDEAGNMASKTDATGKQTLMEYDKYGRLTRKEFVGVISTTYLYDSYGQLTDELDSNGAYRLFYYDQYGRLAFSCHSIDENCTHELYRSYTYNTDGNLSSIEYESPGMPLGMERYEYSNGHVKNIIFDSYQLGKEFDIWNVQMVNGYGLLEVETRGGLLTYYEYDTLLRLYICATELNESDFIREIQYEYDNSGNVIRRDNTLGYNELFTYDHMNRLIDDGSITYEYDEQTGNMVYNSRVGSFSPTNTFVPDYRIAVIDHSVLGGSMSCDYISTDQQAVTYNAMSRPTKITENTHNLEFTYNGRGERIKSYFYTREKPNPLVGTITTDIETRYYLGNIYERHIKQDGEDRVILYLGGDAYSAPAAFVMDDEYGPHIAYILRDRQGSITHLISDKYQKEYSYDAWGNLRDPESYEIYIPRTTTNELYLGRGYTGHEHHGYFGLINMNARLYDPIMCRFLSPDPFVQMPDNSQNFNRYLYCMNNPLKYTDESGEFWFEIFNYVKDFCTNTFVKVWSQGINAWTKPENWHSTHMAFKINMGRFEGNFKQVFSRFTWEMPQTILGYGLAQGLNIFNDVKSVTYYGGATVTETKSSGWSAVTLGSYIAGREGIKADPYNALFQHEYGHYLQSQAWGPMYLGKAGIPSILDTKGRKGDHDLHPIEQDANARAFEYFNKNVKGFYKTSTQYDSGDIGWNFYENPLNLHGTNRGAYVDYDKQMDDVRKLRVSFRAAEYLMLNPITLGLYNHIRYNHTKIRE